MNIFIKFLLIISLVFQSALINAQTGKPLFTASIGVQAYTFRRSISNDVAKVLDTLKMMGFTELEGGNGSLSPEEFKKLCNDRGITLPSMGVGYEQLVKSPDSMDESSRIIEQIPQSIS